MELVFDNARYLTFLLFVLIIIFIHFFSIRYFKKKAVPFANFDTLKRISAKYLFTQNHTQLVIRILIIVLLVFVLAGPKLVYLSDSAEPNTLFLIDASDSMFTTNANLFDTAKQLYYQYAESHDYITSVGVVTYSVTSVIAVQPTTSRERALLGSNSILRHDVSGTDIGTALLNGLFLASTQEGGKRVILISDGKGIFGTSLATSIDVAATRRIPVSVIILGDSHNENILQSLSDVSKTTSGNYIKLSDVAGETTQNKLDAVVSDLISGENSLVVYDLRFVFLLTCLILLVLEWALAKSIYKIVPF